jgi:hypothetical protein
MSGLNLKDTSRIESLSARREISDAAKALLADKAFGHVYRDLYERWYAQLLDAPPGSPEQADLVASIRALESLLVELGLLLQSPRQEPLRPHNAP